MKMGLPGRNGGSTLFERMTNKQRDIRARRAHDVTLGVETRIPSLSKSPPEIPERALERE